MADAAAKPPLLKAIEGLLETGAHSDFVITCRSQKFHVHKSVVCSQSDFFEKALTFAVGKEAEENRVDLPGDEPAIVELMVQHFYKTDYNPTCVCAEPIRPEESYYAAHLEPHSCSTAEGDCSHDDAHCRICPHHLCGYECDYTCYRFVCTKCNEAPEGGAEQLLTHAKIYEIADKYHVEALKILAADKFRRACYKFWDDPYFPIAAGHACSTTPESDMGLRHTVEATISAHRELIETPDIEDLLYTFNGVALRLLKENTTWHGKKW